MRLKILALLIACVLLASCAKDNAPPAESPASSPFAGQTMELALFQGGFGEDYWISVVSAFKEHYPGVTVTYRIHPNIGDLIRPDLLSGNAPDFLYNSDSNSDGLVAMLVQNHALTDLTEVFSGQAYDSEEALRDLVLPGLLENPCFAPYGDGKIFMAPFSYGPLGFVYNETLFAKHGWQVPETWDEFFALGDAARKEGIALMTYPGIYPGYLESLVFPAIADKAGMAALNRLFQLEKGSVEQSDVLVALSQIKRISDDGYLLQGSFGWSHLQAQAALMQDKALFIPNGVWIQNEMASFPRTAGFQFGLAAAPTFANGTACHVQISYEQLMIPKAAKNPELAKEFLRFLYTDTSLKLFAEKADGVFSLKRGLDLAGPYLVPSTRNMYRLLQNEKYEVFLPGFVSSDRYGSTPYRLTFLYSFASNVLEKGMPVDLWAHNMETVFDSIRAS